MLAGSRAMLGLRRKHRVRAVAADRIQLLNETILPQHPPLPSPHLPFVELGRLGRQEWWRVAVVCVLIPVISPMLGTVLDVFLDRLLPGYESAIHNHEASGWGTDYPLWLGVLAFSRRFLGIALWLPTALILVQLVHRRPWQSLIVASNGFAWRSFFASLVAALAVFGVLRVLRPEDVHIVFDGWQFAAFLAPLLLLVPAQTLAEEVVFRGYVLQCVAAVTGNITLRLAIPSVLFAAAHLPNVFTTAGLWVFVHHLVFAVYVTFLVMRWNGLAHAWGFHLGWNWLLTAIVPAEHVHEPRPVILAFDQTRADSGFLAGILFMAGCAAHYWLTKYLVERHGARPGGQGS